MRDSKKALLCIALALSFTSLVLYQWLQQRVLSDHRQAAFSLIQLRSALKNSLAASPPLSTDEANTTLFLYAGTLVILGASTGYVWLLALRKSAEQTPDVLSMWEQLSSPLALLTTDLQIAHANASFLRLTNMNLPQVSAYSLTDLIVDLEGRHFLGDPKGLRNRSVAREMTALLLSVDNQDAPHVVRFSLASLTGNLYTNTKQNAAFVATFQNLDAEFTVVTVREQLWQVLGSVLRAHLRIARDLLEKVCASAQERLTAESIKALTLAQDESRRLERMILNLVMVEAGNSLPFQLDIGSCQSGTIIEKAISAVRAEARKANQTIDIQDEDFELHADQDIIVQVLINLISNAISHTPPGGRIMIRGFQTDRSARFEVHDTDPGIPEDTRAQLFDRYRRGGFRNPDRKGLGLGLALCKVLVETHGGTISVTAVCSGGSNFFFELPV